MKRRDFLTGLACTAVATPLALAAQQQSNDRIVFKILFIEGKAEDPVTVVRVGSEHWLPTPEELIRIRDAYIAAAGAAKPIVVPYNVELRAVQPITVMVKAGLSELKPGDTFVMYEPSGERVPGTWLAQDEPVCTLGVWSCSCTESLDAVVPDQLPI